MHKDAFEYEKLSIPVRVYIDEIGTIEKLYKCSNLFEFIWVNRHVTVA